MRARRGVRGIVLAVILAAVGWTFYNAFGKEQNAIGPGDAAPDFVAQTVQGSTVQLSHLKGKGALVNFWGTWCPPCREEMPALQQAALEFKGKNVEVIAVNAGEADVTVASYLRTNQIDTLAVALDPSKEISRRYKITPLPTSFFINPDGTLYKKVEGGMTLATIRDNLQQIAPKR
ncbi:thiol-disulfide isomerase/thioredoxin [Aneurinibacillus soli]|uniref:Thiol-disulfide oxidoreductase ResA n=1 Tax=Aneurinibacillus soli TaxID=1500254 RepID=A0A0U5B3X4_9BACL|nr:thiol-disulfide oxidoreductase ResA [Aneurinibacillus soli]PYE62886.1 thiol-disulfide isomerase/thioredoxin [Aneurinibacillus soli]BAU29056.1 Thiol-disulfide oxidoreductase ResA [Aneurinibacillus soli]